MRLFDWGAAPLFLDIGANRGLATDAMHLLVPQSEIVSFEPNPILYKQLVNLYSDVTTVKCMNIALGDASIDATLWVPVYRNWVFDGLASLDRREAAEWLNGDRIYFFDERHLHLHEQACKIRRLDEFDLSPAFIKIDVQGHELDVLRGAAQTLERYHPLLMIEDASNDELIQFLKIFQYTIAHFDGQQMILHSAGRVNSFFLADKHVTQFRKRATSV